MKKNKTRTKKRLTAKQEKIVTLSAEAAKEMKQALRRYSASGVRIAAKQNENGTLSFSLDLEESSQPDDLVATENGVKLFLDPASARLVQGLEIRYAETERGSGFVFVNPHG